MSDNIQANTTGRLMPCLQKKIDKMTYLVEVHFSDTSTQSVEAIKIDPKNLHPHTELGRLLSRQKGREEEAEKYLREAIEIDAGHLHSRTVLAKLYESMGRLSEARQLYQEIFKHALVTVLVWTAFLD